MNLGKKKEKKVKPPKRGLGFLERIGLGDEKKDFIENLSMMIASGINVLDALEAIREEVKTPQMKKVIIGLEEDIQSGMPLHKGLARTNLFSEHVLALIRIGEKAGRLAENLKVIEERQQKEAAFNAKVKTAMAYPTLVLSFTILVGIGLAWFILPRLSKVFLSLNMELPLLTRIIIGSGDFLNKNGMVFIPSLVFGIFLVIYFIFVFSKTKFIGQAILSRTPVIEKFIKQVQLARFGFTLGTLLEAGLPINESLKSVANSTTSKAHRKLYLYLQDKVDSGYSLKKCFSENKKAKRLIPSAIQQIIAVGEESGRLPESLLKVGKTFEDKVDNTSKNLTAFVEPILLIVVGLAVGLIAMGVILPIYSLMGGVSGNQSVGQPAVTESVSSEDQLVIPEEELFTLTITVAEEEDYVYVYDQPSLDAEIIARARVGDVYGLYDEYLEDEDWYGLISADGEVAWVLSQYAEIDEE